MAYDSEDQPQQEQQPEYEGFDLDRYKRMWQEVVSDYSQPRVQHFRDEEYYDGDVRGTGWGQWTETELAKLSNRKQPPTVFNIIYRKINAIAGVEQRSRSEPRAMPRTPKDQAAAEICTDTLRFIKDRTNWEFIKAEAFLDALKIGYAAVEITGASDCVAINPIDWKDFFFDPRSRRPDFSDARYLGVAKWIDADTALDVYMPEDPEQPEIPPQPQDPSQLRFWAMQAQQAIAEWEKAKAKRAQIEQTIKDTATGSSNLSGAADTDFDDRPTTTFGDAKRKRIFVVDMWHRDPKVGWMRCVFTGAGKLFTEAATLTERDQWGREVKTHPIHAFSLHVSRDLWRYGEVRSMRSPQDEVNKRRSKALHLLTMNRVRATPQALESAGGKEAVRNEVARPDAVLSTQYPQELLVDSNIELAQGQQRLGEEAVAYLEQAGPNPQLQGIQGNAQSGRAVLALQQAGLGALGPVFDRFHEWETRCYRSMWFRVQQFWDAPMYVRVTDDKNAARFAAVNGAPVIDQDNGNTPSSDDPRYGIGGNGGPPMGPDDMGGMMPAQPPQMPLGGPMGAMAGMPNMQDEDAPQQFGPMLAELDMDIIIDRAPEAATLQAEQYETLAQLAQAGVLGPPGDPDIARMLITSSSLPEKTQLLDLLDKKVAQQKPNPQQMAQLKELEAKVAAIVANTQKTQAETAKIGAEIPQKHAETAKIGAEAQDASTQATMNRIGAARTLALGGMNPAAVLTPAYNFQPTDMLSAPPPQAPQPPPMPF